MKKSYWLGAMLMAGTILLTYPVYAEDAKAAADTTEQDPSIAEGYTEKGEGWTSVVTWTKNGDMNIYGKVFYPADYVEGEKYPTIIMAHGTNATHKIYESCGWTDYCTSQGMICYTFDFCGSSLNSLSDGENGDYTNETESDDLNAIIDFIESQSWCDTDNLFLMGQSRGGSVAAMTAPERVDEIAGMILLYPALEPYYDIIGDYTKDVLIIHGREDKTVPVEQSVAAMEYYNENSELLIIEGDKSMHAFEKIDEEGRALAQEKVGKYLAEHITE